MDNSSSITSDENSSILDLSDLEDEEDNEFDDEEGGELDFEHLGKLIIPILIPMAAKILGRFGNGKSLLFIYEYIEIFDIFFFMF